MEKIAKNETVAVQKQELGTAFPKNDLDKTTKPKAKRSVQLGSQMWNDEKAAIGRIYMPIGKLLRNVLYKSCIRYVPVYTIYILFVNDLFLLKFPNGKIFNGCPSE